MSQTPRPATGEPANAPTRYRRNVGIMLIDRCGRVLIGRRLDTPGEAWQMPQGGIDEAETPEQAAWREMMEEVGTDKAELLGATRDWVRYDLPPELAGRLWGGGYRGQEQKWFAFRFTGQDSDIDIARHEPEFAEWRWVDPAELLRIIVPFKREVYARVIEELSPLIALCRGGRAEASAGPRLRPTTGRAVPGGRSHSATAPPAPATPARAGPPPHPPRRDEG